jgi:uncharacterized protein (UPF0276 family)
LLDINNIHVSAHNLGFDAQAYLAEIPAEAVGEYHLAGHEEDAGGVAGLLIDTHGAPIIAPVWSLYETVLDLIGPRPTLIERDTNIPSYESLLAEGANAQARLEKARLKAEAIHA